MSNETAGGHGLADEGPASQGRASQDAADQDAADQDATDQGRTASWAPDACTLPTAERPLRAANFDELFAGAVLGIGRPAPTRLRLDLRHDPAAAGRVAELAAAETGCCSFFSFTLTVTGSALTLDVAVPAAYVAVLDALGDRAAAVAGAAGVA